MAEFAVSFTNNEPRLLLLQGSKVFTLAPKSIIHASQFVRPLGILGSTDLHSYGYSPTGALDRVLRQHNNFLNRLGIPSLHTSAAKRNARAEPKLEKERTHTFQKACHYERKCTRAICLRRESHLYKMILVQFCIVLREFQGALPELMKIYRKTEHKQYIKLLTAFPQNPPEHLGNLLLRQ
jgi:hypothetical protein